jgi:GntR family transcriptional regulator
MVSSAIVVIDEASPEHPYLQLAARLREQIQAGEIVSRLPSLTELTSQTGLAVGTVRRAIDVLARERLVRTVPGRGTFVIAAQR